MEKIDSLGEDELPDKAKTKRTRDHDEKKTGIFEEEKKYFSGKVF